MPLTAGHPWVHAPVNPVFRWSRVQLSCRNARHYVEAGAYVKRQCVRKKEREKGRNFHPVFDIWLHCSAWILNTPLHKTHRSRTRYHFAPFRYTRCRANWSLYLILGCTSVILIRKDKYIFHTRDIISHVIFSRRRMGSIVASLTLLRSIKI